MFAGDSIVTVAVVYITVDSGKAMDVITRGFIVKLSYTLN